MFPGFSTRLSWSFDDPAGFEGSCEEKLAKTRIVRDAIRKHVEEFIATVGKTKPEKGILQ